MRKIYVAMGIVLVAASLVIFAFIDTQLRFALFGFAATSFQTGGGGFQPSGGQFQRPSTSSTLETGYVRIVPYLLGAAGLCLMTVGSILAPRKKEKEVDLQAPAPPPPWERSDVSSGGFEESKS